MSRIIIASILRNEASRYLRPALRAWTEIADEIVAIDNGSTDETPALLKAAGATLIDPPSPAPMWGNEAPFRRALIEGALASASPEDIIFFLDGDMWPLTHPSPLFRLDADVYHFILFDLWNEHEYRYEPPFWIAAENWRPWAVRAGFLEGLDASLIRRGIHCGHIPPYSREGASEIFSPAAYGLLHWGWAKEEDRAKKAKHYNSVSDSLSKFEQSHVDTILDEAPVLRRLPYEPEWAL